MPRGKLFDKYTPAPLGRKKFVRRLVPLAEGTPANEHQNNYFGALAYPRACCGCNGRTGCVGFGWGGSQAYLLASPPG